LIAPKTADEFIWKILSSKQRRLGMAGLMAEIENLVTNINKMSFNVKDTAAALENNNSTNKLPLLRPPFQAQTTGTYVFDDDEDEAEILKHLDSLPVEFFNQM
jgi:hypothetical protein